MPLEIDVITDDILTPPASSATGLSHLFHHPHFTIYGWTKIRVADVRDSKKLSTKLVGWVLKLDTHWKYPQLLLDSSQINETFEQEGFMTQTDVIVEKMPLIKWFTLLERSSHKIKISAELCCTDLCSMHDLKMKTMRLWKAFWTNEACNWALKTFDFCVYHRNKNELVINMIFIYIYGN